MWTEGRSISRRWWSVVLVLAQCVVLNAAAVSYHCPKSCFCNRPSGIVFCSQRGLSAIPANISATSREINLNGNPFVDTALRRVNVSRFGELERLYINDCGIESIEVHMFVDLVNLKWLDLSNNRITEVAEYTFRGLDLMYLFLNGNRNIRLYPRSFEGLVTTGLYLHECALSRLAVNVLAPLNTTLRSLWLDGNELERLDKKFLSVFRSLSHIRLGSNPLHCNCEAVWLKEFYDKNGGLFTNAPPPSCLTPASLRGSSFDELSLSDLRCQRPAFNNIDARLGAEGGRLRCSAAGDPAPTLFWVRPSGVTTKYDAPVGDTARSNEAILKVDTSGNGDVAGMYTCLALNDAGNVTLTNTERIVATQNGHRYETSGRSSTDNTSGGKNNNNNSSQEAGYSNDTCCLESSPFSARETPPYRRHSTRERDERTRKRPQLYVARYDRTRATSPERTPVQPNRTDRSGDRYPRVYAAIVSNTDAYLL